MSPASCSTSATTRPEGTSIVTGTILLSVAVILPVSTAHTPSAIVPCPHAVENPSLCQKRTPKSAPSSSGGTTNPPYISACPHGSLQRNCRSRSSPSAPDCARTRRCAPVIPEPAASSIVTMRNGSPVVWYSSVRTDLSCSGFTMVLTHCYTGVGQNVMETCHGGNLAANQGRITSGPITIC